MVAAYSQCRTLDRLVPVRYQLPCSLPAARVARASTNTFIQVRDVCFGGLVNGPVDEETGKSLGWGLGGLSTVFRNGDGGDRERRIGEEKRDRKIEKRRGRWLRQVTRNES